jgi:hypothetical protein
MQCELPLPDLAVQIESQIQEVQSALKEADEVFRQFRAAILANPPLAENIVPVEWIPISDQ